MRTRVLITAVIATAALAGCSDVQPPDSDALASAASSLASRASSAVESATTRPTPDPSLTAPTKTETPDTPETEASESPEPTEPESPSPTPKPTSSSASPKPTSAQPTTSSAEPTESSPEPSLTSAPETSAEPTPTPSSATPTPSTTEAADAEPNDDSSTVWWVLLALAAAAAVGGGIWLMRRRAAVAEWDRAFQTSAEKARWVAETGAPRLVTASGPDEVQRTLVELEQALNQADQGFSSLEADVPDQNRTAHLSRTRQQVAGLHAALVGLATAIGEGADAASQRQAGASVEAARQALLKELAGPPQP